MSDTDSRVDGGVEFAPTNYGFSIGTWLGLDQQTALGGDGAFGYNSGYGLEAITDGTSNTLCAAEVKTFVPALLDGNNPWPRSRRPPTLLRRSSRTAAPSTPTTATRNG